MSSSSCPLCASLEHPRLTPRAYLCLPLCVCLRVRGNPMLKKRCTCALCGSHVSFLSLKTLTLTFVPVEHINNHQRCSLATVAIDAFERACAPSKSHAYAAKAVSSPRSGFCNPTDIIDCDTDRRPGPHWHAIDLGALQLWILAHMLGQ